MFYIAFFIISAACSAITIKTLVGYSDMKLIGKMLASAAILLGWCAPLIISALRYSSLLNPKVFAVISFAGYTLLGFVFIIFCLLMLRDIFWYGIYGSAKLLGFDNWALNPKNISVLSHANIIVVILGGLISAYALYQGTKVPEIMEITIDTPLIKHDMRIVHLSDLHIDRTTPVSRVRKIVEEVNRQNPDLILMTGDIVDDGSTMLDAQMAELRKLSAPDGVYASLGNHEFYNGLNAWMYQYKKLGFIVLFNKGMSIANNVFLSGIPDAFTANSNMGFNVNLKRSLAGSDPKHFKILLSHNPELVNSISSFNYQLMLSGHTHGGQIFPFHFFVKKANQYLSGDYKVNGINLHVSPGGGTWGPSMRLFAPSEIAVISLRKI